MHVLRTLRQDVWKSIVTWEYKSFFYNHQEFLALFNVVYLHFTGAKGSQELIIKQDSHAPINGNT